jgi:hypothetical protein
MIEAPWLVNGGHGASLRHHKAAGETITTSPWVQFAGVATCHAIVPFRSAPRRHISTSIM